MTAAPNRPIRPIGRGVIRLWVVLVAAFALLASGAGYWQVVRSADLVARADDPLLISIARGAVRGEILDRNGKVLASSKKDANGEPYRAYASKSVSQVVGYASQLYGTSGLERAYDAELTGLRSVDPISELLGKFGQAQSTPQDLTTSLSLSLQQKAVSLLGGNRGAIVMLDPRTGEVLVLASTPTFDASALANPATSRATFKSLSADTADPLLDRATMGRYAPGSVFKIVTSVAALGSGAITPATTFPQQPAAESTGLLVSGFRVHDGHHPFTGSTPVDYASAVEVSCNIYFALAGLRTGGQQLSSWASRLGFGAPIPFDLPTASSQVTNGGGSFGGGFADDVELANASYGQAEVLATPLQMALVASTVANDGVLMKPRLVTKISSSAGSQQIGSQTIGQVMPPDVAATITAAMVRAVNGRYGQLFTRGAQLPGIQVAGKTGTAQIDGPGQPHSWFIGFAPANNPQVVIAVLVEQGGSGSSKAAPIAGQMLAAYFAGGQ